MEEKDMELVMPDTGGIGTTLFLVVGLGMMLAALFLLRKSKK
ncbi:LPXTG cell wall anchor domain-containing protein [Trichococcus shcherbakoviae subsp. psychrophilus]|jgi:LPXTG-motif cell wall-anchored protein|uniref:LPXTG cell wall anchor domain-containing protein n=2 Tax=Trichococcus shcherbakoviae TaxID=2094020 RepID=A0A5C5EBN3_9LACT|nr:LPXTG cell wall anchor domain-containing protein [Trichococcus shcherbakoviae subsp. psychrophilus]